MGMPGMPGCVSGRGTRAGDVKRQPVAGQLHSKYHSAYCPAVQSSTLKTQDTLNELQQHAQLLFQLSCILGTSLPTSSSYKA